MASVLDSLLHSFRQAACALPDPRRGANKRYTVADAAACALAPFFFQTPSFLEFQRHMQQETSRSNCHTLFGVQAIPCDNHYGNPAVMGPRPRNPQPVVVLRPDRFP